MDSKAGFYLEQGDIFTFKADALVYSTNKKPVIGTNTLDSQVFSKAGNNLCKERLKRGELKSGDAIITRSFNLERSYRRIIHAVAPYYDAWKGNKKKSEELLIECYKKIFAVSQSVMDVKSIVCPLLSTGALKCPPIKSYSCALLAYTEFMNELLDAHDTFDVRFTLVIYNMEDLIKIEKIHALFNHATKDGGLRGCDENQLRAELADYQEHRYHQLPTVATKDEVVQAYNEILALIEVERDRRKLNGEDAETDEDTESKIDARIYISQFFYRAGIKSESVLAKCIGLRGSGSISKFFYEGCAKRWTAMKKWYMIMLVLHLTADECTTLYRLIGYEDFQGMREDDIKREKIIRDYLKEMNGCGTISGLNQRLKEKHVKTLDDN